MISVKKYPFVRCLNPQPVVNKYTGQAIVVPCGNCEACMLQKSAMSTLKCRLEAQVHEYCYFVTLTYDDHNVPLCDFVQSDEILFETNKWKYIIVDSSNNPMYAGQILGEMDATEIDVDSVRRKSNHGGMIAYLRQHDIQLFLKRLRKYIYEDSKEKIRYYCVGELGPKHYRPHWHILLYFDGEQTATNLRQNILKSWRFGFVDVGKASGKGISYVAGYVNSSSAVPKIFRNSATQPKCTHSIKLGEAVFKDCIEKVHQYSAVDFVRRSMPIGDRNAEFSLWRSLQNYYYPKCSGYAIKHPSELYNTYTVITKARKITGLTRPFAIAKTLTQMIRNRSKCGLNTIISDAYNTLLDWFIYETDHVELPFTSDCYKYDYWPKLQQKIYRVLFTSAHFVDVVCHGDSNLFRSKIRVISQFYLDLECVYFYNMLEQEDIIMRSNSPEDVKYLYTNILGEADLMELLNTKVSKAFKEATICNFENSMKHKRMNDEFDLFDPANLSYNTN